MILPDKENCCGCECCIEACSHGAISAGYDALGFMIPKLDETACVGCGRCDIVCPFNKPAESIAVNRPISYAARNVSVDVVKQSRSGGIFSLIAEAILTKGGVVYGAALSKDMIVSHIRVDSPADISKLRGSKYAQSRMSGVYYSVLQDVKRGVNVLFSGTPCQVYALKEYLPKVFLPRLFTIDIVCHGVASPAVWNEFVGFVGREQQAKVVAADFRDKIRYGWDGLHKESFRVKGRSGKVFVPFHYYGDFQLRHSCNNCPFTSLQRPSDLTIGDLWSWRETAPELNRDKLGCSLILVNTEACSDMIDAVSDKLIMKRVDIESILQPNMQRPSIRSQIREQYEEDFKNLSFDKVLAKYHTVKRPSVITIIKNKFFNK